jgi:hypothetical protein
MKIQATCDTCARKFLLSQIGPDSDAPGRCPFCGARFARHYNTVLVETVDDTEKLAERFLKALKSLQDIEKGFTIDLGELMSDLTGGVSEHDQHLSTG